MPAEQIEPIDLEAYLASIKFLSEATNAIHICHQTPKLDNKAVKRIFAEFAKHPEKARRITSISFAGNAISALPNLNIFPNLRTLKLTRNQFTIGPVVAACQNLRCIDMLQNPLDLPPIGLKQLPALESLFLPSPCTDVGKAAVTMFRDFIRAKQGSTNSPFNLVKFDRTCPTQPLQVTCELLQSDYAHHEIIAHAQIQTKYMCRRPYFVLISAILQNAAPIPDAISDKIITYVLPNVSTTAMATLKQRCETLRQYFGETEGFKSFSLCFENLQRKAIRIHNRNILKARTELQEAIVARRQQLMESKAAITSQSHRKPIHQQSVTLESS